MSWSSFLFALILLFLIFCCLIVPINRFGRGGLGVDLDAFRKCIDDSCFLICLNSGFLKDANSSLQNICFDGRQDIDISFSLKSFDPSTSFSSAAMTEID